MKARNKVVISLSLMLVLASTAAVAARAFYEDGFYLDEQGNVVGGSTIPCNGPEVFWGVRTDTYVVTLSGSCRDGY